MALLPISNAVQRIERIENGVKLSASSLKIEYGARSWKNKVIDINII